MNVQRRWVKDHRKAYKGDKETRKQKPNQEVQRERLGTPFSREQTIFIERDEKSSIEEWKKREKEDVLKMRDFRKERKPEIKIHTKEVRKKTFW